MRKEGLSQEAIHAFRHNYLQLIEGQTGLVSESELEPVVALPDYDSIRSGQAADAVLLAQAAVLKLNGGLGTSMGLDRAKSLLVIKDGLTFLDLLAKQILHQRKRYACAIPFCLMNSFSTQADTLDYLARYPDLAGNLPLDFVQSKVPKLDARSFEPISWPQNEALEWCPPGHGDLYPSLVSTGLLDRFLEQGIRYLFVSNADNLGASLDPEILRYFAESAFPFMMEVAERTEADRKGGHLALRRSNGRFLLRESAQCPTEDEPHFQNIERHRYFNTNNLWIDLESLRERLDEEGGLLPLPLIRNAKTVDPRDAASTKVYQLETAMGSAIEVFPGASALVVPRSRFAPVKTTSDLLVLRSDAYEIREDWTLQKSEDCAMPPKVSLDERHYKKVNDFEACFAAGVPSIKACKSLEIRGALVFEKAVRCVGKVSFQREGEGPGCVKSGVYEGVVKV
ncbi:MAG: UTP--glucose-1-phosphate uridylyltransferase [Blastochloris sp.]|nr:UTP--glucose-1-phosphate uridylyltransferase [Blastochloris sp.]